MTIPPCTTGTHSAVDDTPAPEPTQSDPATSAKKVSPASDANTTTEQPAPRIPQPQPQAATPKPSASAAQPPLEDESDDPEAVVPAGVTCKRRGCNAVSGSGGDRDAEECTHHPGQALFHEGSKGWTCCKRRVLEFDEFLRIAGCKTKKRHLFVGSKKEGGGEEAVESVR